MESKITYKGVTTTISDNLMERPVVVTNPPRKSFKFDVPSLYYDGKYWFLQDLKDNDRGNGYRQRMYDEGRVFEIQVVFYSGKWYQDTFYIDRGLKELLESYWE